MSDNEQLGRQEDEIDKDLDKQLDDSSYEVYIYVHSQEDSTAARDLMATLVARLGAESSDDTVQFTLKTIASRSQHEQGFLYPLLHELDAENVLFGPLLDRKSEKLLAIVGEAVIVMFAWCKAQDKSPDPELAAKAVDVLLSITVTADEERRTEIFTILNGAPIGSASSLHSLGSNETINKVVFAVVRRYFEPKIMSPNTEPRAVIEDLRTIAEYGYALSLFDSPDAVESLKTAIATSTLVAKMNELIHDCVALFMAQDWERDPEDGMAAAILVISFIADAGDEVVELAAKEEATIRRRQAVIADEHLVDDLQQLFKIPNYESSFHKDGAARLLAALAQADREKLFPRGPKEASDMLKPLKQLKADDVGQLRLLIEYLQDPACLAATIKTRPTLLATFRKSLVLGVQKGHDTRSQYVRFFKAAVAEHGKVAWDQALGKALVTLVTQYNESDYDVEYSSTFAAAGAADLLLAFIEADPARCDIVATPDCVASLRSAVNGVGLNRKTDKAPFARLLVRVSPTKEIVVTAEQLKTASEVLLAEEDADAKAAAGPILAWLRESVLTASSEDATFKEVIDEALAGNESTTPPDEQAVFEEYEKLSSTYLSGRSRVARLVLLGLGVRSSTLLALLDSMKPNPGLDVGRRVLEQQGYDEEDVEKFEEEEVQLSYLVGSYIILQQRCK